MIIETNEFRNECFEYFDNNWIDRSIKPTENFIDFTWNKISCHKLTSCKFDFTFSYFTAKVFRIKKNRSKNQVKQWMIFVLQINNFSLTDQKMQLREKLSEKLCLVITRKTTSGKMPWLLRATILTYRQIVSCENDKGSNLTLMYSVILTHNS